MKMYNEDVKQRFLNNIDLNKYPPAWWERVFDKSSIFEELYQRDLYDFSTSNIIEFFKYLDAGDINTLIVYRANLIKYAEWAASEHLVADNQIHFSELNIDILSDCMSRTRIDNSIITFDKLNSIHWVNAQDAFVFWALFEGIKGKDFEEIVNLKIEDIDRSTNTVKLCTGRTMKVPDKFIMICDEAWMEEEYYALKDKKFVIKLIQGLNIYKEKSMSRSVDTPRSVYNTIIRNIQYLPDMSNNIKAKSIRDSGLIHYLNQRADEYEITVEQLFYDIPKCGDIIDKYCFNILTRRKWMKMYQDHLH